MYVFKSALLPSLIFILLTGCYNGTDKKYPSLPGYDIGNPHKYNLRDELAEISGVVYYPRDSTVFAINDENGLLYKIFLRKNVEVMKWKFDSGADFEDLALADSNFFALQSNGNIVSFRVLARDSVLVGKYKRPYQGKNEFETLYYDTFRKKLVLICKDCEADNKKQITAWAFDVNTRTYSDTPLFTINARSIDKMMGVQKEKYKPSAAAIHPITNELYMLFSVNKALVIADSNGVVKSAISLNPAIYKQPEGLNFTPQGTMIISNESAEAGPANLLILKYKR